MDELITQSNITPTDYNTLYPLFTFDVSKQKEKLKSSAVDVRIRANVTENVPASIKLFALVISDKMFCHSNQVGKKFCSLLKNASIRYEHIKIY